MHASGCSLEIAAHLRSVRCSAISIGLSAFVKKSIAIALLVDRVAARR
jgi:hypothetical protein